MIFAEIDTRKYYTNKWKVIKINLLEQINRTRIPIFKSI
ncbi:hypothetical protein BTBSAS_50026 [Brochothrix thermosphacta]|uniref:Uncharacterized protein n=1 Tax=Brochothrix thermosphacta TaxID=2756 RepID=A0A2X0QYN6_BROTH|nr:hypothetical protein BTBSAS_50026 [Brochothrix thermosphacta]